MSVLPVCPVCLWRWTLCTLDDVATRSFDLQLVEVDVEVSAVVSAYTIPGTYLYAVPTHTCNYLVNQAIVHDKLLGCHPLVTHPTVYSFLLRRLRQCMYAGIFDTVLTQWGLRRQPKRMSRFLILVSVYLPVNEAIMHETLHGVSTTREIHNGIFLGRWHGRAATTLHGYQYDSEWNLTSLSSSTRHSTIWHHRICQTITSSLPTRAPSASIIRQIQVHYHSPGRNKTPFLCPRGRVALSFGRVAQRDRTTASCGPFT